MPNFNALQFVIRSTFNQLTRLSSIRPATNAFSLLNVKNTINSQQIRCLEYNKNKKKKDNLVSKTNKPQTIPITKANKHLEIKLFNENDELLGIMPMDKANMLAKEQNLKLIMINEKENPPRFRLVTGKELFRLQLEARAKAKDDKNKTLTDKEIYLTLKTSDHDLEHKLKHMKELFDKGNHIVLNIDSKMNPNLVDEIKEAQGAFLGKLKALIDFANLTVSKTSEKTMVVNLKKKIDIELNKPPQAVEGN